MKITEIANDDSLRHTFQKLPEGARDITAVRAIMGHVDASMSATYREFASEAATEMPRPFAALRGKPARVIAKQLSGSQLEQLVRIRAARFQTAANN